MTAVTLREMRDRYLHEAGLGDGGYDDNWVRVMLGPVPIVFPNTTGRKRVVPIHDLHHALTGYRSDWTGESEIAAWELATGCRRHVAAWFLNLSVLALGVLVAPRRTFRAFLRGRHTSNLYGDVADAALLARNVSDVRHDLHLDDDREHHATLGDALAFARIVALTLPIIVFWVGPPVVVIMGFLKFL